MIALTFVLCLALSTFGGILSLVAIASDRVTDKRFVFPCISLSALGACTCTLILLATR